MTTEAVDDQGMPEWRLPERRSPAAAGLKASQLRKCVRCGASRQASTPGTLALALSTPLAGAYARLSVDLSISYRLRRSTPEVKEQILLSSAGLFELAIMRLNGPQISLRRNRQVHRTIEEVAQQWPEPVHVHQECIMALDGGQGVELHVPLAVPEAVSDAALMINGEQQIGFDADNQRSACTTALQPVFH